VTVVIDVPSGDYPYYRLILVGAVLSFLAVWYLSEANTKASIIVGYALTAMNLFASGVFVLTTVS
jgi:hypothetical protein